MPSLLIEKVIVGTCSQCGSPQKVGVFRYFGSGLKMQLCKGCIYSMLKSVEFLGGHKFVTDQVDSLGEELEKGGGSYGSRFRRKCADTRTQMEIVGDKLGADAEKK